MIRFICCSSPLLYKASLSTRLACAVQNELSKGRYSLINLFIYPIARWDDERRSSSVLFLGCYEFRDNDATFIWSNSARLTARRRRNDLSNIGQHRREGLSDRSWRLASKPETRRRAVGNSPCSFGHRSRH